MPISSQYEPGTVVQSYGSDTIRLILETSTGPEGKETYSYLEYNKRFGWLFNPLRGAVSQIQMHSKYKPTGVVVPPQELPSIVEKIKRDGHNIIMDITTLSRDLNIMLEETTKRLPAQRD